MKYPGLGKSIELEIKLVFLLGLEKGETWSYKFFTLCDGSCEALKDGGKINLRIIISHLSDLSQSNDCMIKTLVESFHFLLDFDNTY